MIGYFAEVTPDLRYVQCHAFELPSEIAPEPAHNGNTLVPVAAPPATWVGGSPTEVLHLIDGAEQWVETADLPALKLRKRAEITRDRLAADADHFEYQGKAIRTAEKDLFDILIADARWNKSKPANWPGGWLAVDDSYVLIDTKEEWDAFFIAMYDTGIFNFFWSQQLKARVFAAQAPEELATIRWAAPTSP